MKQLLSSGTRSATGPVTKEQTSYEMRARGEHRSRWMTAQRLKAVNGFSQGTFRFILGMAKTLTVACLPVKSCIWFQEASAEIPLDWREVKIGLGVLAAALTALCVCSRLKRRKD